MIYIIILFLIGCGFQQEKDLADWVNNVKSEEFLEYVVEHGTQVSDSHGATLLHLSVYAGREDLVTILIEKGASLNVLDDYFEQPPLYHAVNKSKSILNKLLKNGADPNFHKDGLKSPLMNAAYLGSLEKLKLLIQYGADVDYSELRGQTALFFAAKARHGVLANVLIKKGADINKEDNGGNSIFIYIARNKDLSTLNDVCSSKNQIIRNNIYASAVSEFKAVGVSEQFYEALESCVIPPENNRSFE